MSKTIVAYIPALHQGYINFFKKNADAGVLYILSTELVREVPRMERDIRAVDPEEMRKIISALGIFSEIKILKKDLNWKKKWTLRGSIPRPSACKADDLPLI